MDITKISSGINPPHDINVVIEVPANGFVKYEFDKKSGALMVDRFLHTAMSYPANYGFIPHTLCGDGDPCDVLVITQAPLVAGSVVRCRPVGALIMEDEAGQDEKIVAVPVDKLHPYTKDIKEYTDIPQILLDQIAHFFEHYKDLEKGKWVKVKNWVSAAEASGLIDQAIQDFAKAA